MITPDYLNNILIKTEDITEEINVYLIKRIAARMASAFNNIGEVDLIPASISDFHKLLDAGMAFDEIQAEIIKQLPKLDKEIRAVFKQSAAEINAYSRHIEKQYIEIMTPNGVVKPTPDPEEVAFEQAAKANGVSEEVVKSLENAYRRTNGTLKNLTQSRVWQNEIVDACDKAFFKVKSGVSMNTAIIEAIDTVAKQGVTVAMYNNRADSIDTAVARAVRTGINQANSEVVLRKCGTLGLNHVKVSSHYGARVTKVNDYTNHAFWQGQVYEIDWDRPEVADFKPDKPQKITEGKRYPEFVKCCGYGNILGICGINCRHTFTAWIPGMSDEPDDIDRAKNEAMYEASQKQRAMERAIRETKRRLAAAKTIDTDEGKQQVKHLRAVLRDQSDKYMQFCKDNNLKPNNMRLKAV